MKNEKLLVGVDEFTIVLQPTDALDGMNWLGKVDAMLEQFLPLSFTEEIFGELVHGLGKPIQGYTQGIFANQPFYFSICWHEHMQNMGIAIRYSAYAWAHFMAEYEQRYGAQMNIAHFLQMVQSDIYTTRLSKIDLAADYQGFGLKVHKIYAGLKEHKLQVQNGQAHRVNLKMSAFELDGAAETVYLGSRKGNTQGFLRLYDKRTEQIANNGFRLDEALDTTDWVRFEAVYKGRYAHQITEALLTEISDSMELQGFIAKMITDKYIFFDVDKDKTTDFSEALYGIAKGCKSKHLRSESPRDNELRQSIRYLVKNAGLMPVVEKISRLYGDDGVTQFWAYLQDQYRQYEPPRDVDAWMNKHGKTMRTQTLADSLS